MRRKWTAVALAVFMAVAPVGNAAAGEVTLDGTAYEEMQALPEENNVSEAAQDTGSISETAWENDAAVEMAEDTQADELFVEPGDDGFMLEEDSAFVQPEGAPSETEGTDGVTQTEDNWAGQPEDGTEIGPEGILVDDFLVGAEEVDPNQEGLTEEMAPELSENVVEQLAASGYASDAQAAKTRTYYAGQYVDSYGGQLSGEARNVYNAMKAAYVDSRGPVSNDEKLVITFAEQFPIANATELAKAQESVRRTMQSAFDAFMYDYPEVFWMDAPMFLYNFSSPTYPSVVTGITLFPRMIYTGAGMEVVAFDQAVRTAYQSAIQGRDVSTASGKVKAIHDYLCNLLIYDEGTTALAKAYAHSAAGVFLSPTKKVVCEGYAKAFKLLCQEAGLESALVVGNAGGAHMWNYVKMDDGKWYVIDATWDDNSSSTPSTVYCLTGAASRGMSGYTIEAERTIYSNFSGSFYTQNFAAPILSRVGYESGADDSHYHTWSIQRQNATCVNYGTEYVNCSACNEKTLHVLELINHRFTNYVSDKNAGWNRDGTMTAVCENGCGTKNTVQDPGSARIPTIKVNVTSLTLKKGQSTTAVKVSGLAKGDKIKSWKSDNTKIVKVNSKGKITAQKKTGKAKVTVTLNSGLKKSITVKVQSGTVKTTKISGVEKTLKLSLGKKKALAPVISPVTSQEKVTYTSSNKKVVTVSSKGVITAKGSGKAKITVKSGSKKAVVTVTVPKMAPQKITNVAASITLKRGKSKTLTPKLSPSGSQAKITYVSSNKSVASVSSSGKITAKKKGKAVITVKAGNVSVKCKVTVK